MSIFENAETLKERVKRIKGDISLVYSSDDMKSAETINIVRMDRALRNLDILYEILSGEKDP